MKQERPETWTKQEETLGEMRSEMLWRNIFFCSCITETVGSLSIHLFDSLLRSWSSLVQL